jgi:DNA helicase II / ATP-dependent DNA helicase PcrA
LLDDAVPQQAVLSADPFAWLNAEQRAAVEHGISNDLKSTTTPLLVIAGAGSGKTHTLAARVVRLVIAGADPQRILLLTFSRRAAAEMTRRVGGLLHTCLGLPSGQLPPAVPWAGTFHSVGARLLREYASHIGLSDAFTIVDRGDAEDLMGWVRQQSGLSATHKRFPLKGTCLAIYSRTVNSQSKLGDQLAEHYPWCAEWEIELGQLFGAYVAEKQRQQVLDYDDLLLYWSHMVSEPALARHVGDRFDHVLVDEYQDTNRLQAAILHAMKPHGQGLTVVGDDAQSIYSFRAADMRNILDFPDRFTPPACIVKLERNYRSTEPILAASNAVIAEAKQRYAKALWTDRKSSGKPLLVAVEDDAAQARWVVDRVLEHRESGLRLTSQAVLFRASHHSAALELELARRNVPFVKFGGLKFLEAAHIKDVVSVLRWAENPRNRLAGYRTALLVAGIGPATVQRLLNEMDGSPEPARALASFSPAPSARDDWALLRDLIVQLRSNRDAWPHELAHVHRWYAPQLERLYDDARVRQADLTQLERIAEGFRSRERFLTELALDPPQATSGEAGNPHLDEDYLILSTMHSAKGQEWQSVHILNAVDGCIPSDLMTGSSQLIEEERRLLYVAMTRARQHLHVLVPQRFYVSQQRTSGDRHVYASLTRFITPSVAEAFEWSGPAPSTDVLPAVPAAAVRSPVDIAATLRSYWA